MFKLLKNYRSYIFYATSIIISRGLEYFVLFYSALYLSKDTYGELEFYKKIIELLAVGFAFGLPSLLLTYTKSDDSKVYLNLLALLFVIFIAGIASPLLWVFEYQYLIIPIVFHALFFNNGVMPIFFITKLGSNKASLYKLVTSFIFYTGIFFLLIFHPNPEKAFIIVNYYLLGLWFVFSAGLFIRYQIKLRFLKKYFGLFRKLLLSSLTLVVSNFANIMFLYTDIMILKLISTTPNTDIANYSFALNIANMLILIPLVLVQVDIEKIKMLKNIRFKKVRIFKLVLIFSIFIIMFYSILVNTFYVNFNDTLILFLIIIIAKQSQANSVIHGAILLVKKEFRLNLIINIIMLILNIILSWVLYRAMMLSGVAVSSLIVLTLRYFALKQFSKI